WWGPCAVCFIELTLYMLWLSRHVTMSRTCFVSISGYQVREILASDISHGL
ncbi:hypothetical protein BDP55DRAFT_669731, partial [Colletotrichum godetiae]